MTAPTPRLLTHDDEVRQQLAAAVEPARLDAAWTAYEEAKIAGLCHEGAWEVALGARDDVPLPSPAAPRP